MAGQHLVSRGLPSLRRTVAVHWDLKSFLPLGVIPDAESYAKFYAEFYAIAHKRVYCSPCYVDAMGKAGMSSQVLDIIVGFKYGQDDIKEKMFSIRHAPQSSRR